MNECCPNCGFRLDAIKCGLTTCNEEATKIYITTRVYGKGTPRSASYYRCGKHPLGNAKEVRDL